jgi:hypothetical protein
MRFDTDPQQRRFAPLFRAGQSRRWVAVVHRFKREFRSNSFPLCSPEMAVKHQFGMNSPLQALGVDCVKGWSFTGVYPISRPMGI